MSISLQSTGGGSACSGSTVTLSTTAWTPPSYTYQWNDANGPITGANTSTYTASVSGSYSLTVTTSDGCTATSDTISVNIINVSVPTGLSTSNIQIDQERL